MGPRAAGGVSLGRKAFPWQVVVTSVFTGDHPFPQRQAESCREASSKRLPLRVAESCHLCPAHLLSRGVKWPRN